MDRRAVPAILGVLVLFAGCGGESGTGAGDQSAGAALEHVHGLGVDPADGVLYAGTHHGLFRAEESSVEGPVAGTVQDFMGFTVAGPKHFLASGHPGPGQDAPAALGLLESTDGGRTWETRALSGEADFHALTYRHGTAYGVNSMTGELLASTDLEDWETRSTDQLFDVAVSPEGPDLLLATTPEGLKLSEDGGRSFSPVEGAPPLVLVEWLDDDTVVGVTPEGTVQIRHGGEPDFATGGAIPGRLEAFHAESATEMYAAAGGRLWASTDGGRSFAAWGAG